MKSQTSAGNSQAVSRKTPHFRAEASTRSPARVRAPVAFSPRTFRTVYESGSMEMVDMVKAGVSAKWVDGLARQMDMPKDRLVDTLGLSQATIYRKVKEGARLDRDASSRVLGMTRLVGQVEAMVRESGDPAGFNAAQWVAQWLEQPLSALGGQRPAELMDTPEGQRIVSQVVARLQSGAYA